MSAHNRGQKCTKANDCRCQKHCLCYACLFDRKSRSLYDGLRGRLAAKKWKTGERAGQIRKEKIDIPYTLDEFRAWLMVTLEDHPECVYCHCSISLMTISPDHAKPVSRGGSLERKNLRGSCSPCNRTKGELLPGEYKALLDGLKTFTEVGRNDVLKRLRGGILHFGTKKKEEGAPAVAKELKATNILAVPAKKKIWDPDF